MRVLVGNKCYHKLHPNGALERRNVNRLGNVANWWKSKCGLSEYNGVELSEPVEEEHVSDEYRRCKRCFEGS